ncbi:S16 family serine protease [Pseudobacteroides cellulosolvens]|uniref:Peptidase S16 lon domain protein n=1 Tax=Pseudobacteroides cellulosolvens ATCC 35603 = DSM 2933 TaxID=398512 RepID=A0A0L6JI63_9FIRM|nr:S16 family serine protease [Pseudobacteroides cellulosolvens]KNY25541.1 peptidase S16 lon domain protein [Pseudobacteroides cellulosolvens ATCC 35603 = DSM 2933]
MNVWALFSDKTAEKVIISTIPCKEGESGLLFRSTISGNNLKESVQCSITNTYNFLLTRFPNNPILLSPIPICIFGFSGGTIVGKSAELSFSLAFILYLVNKGILKAGEEIPLNIAATGAINDRLEIGSVSSLKEKILAAVNSNIELLLYPSKDRDEVEDLINEDEEIRSIENLPKLIPVKALADILTLFGISENRGGVDSEENSGDDTSQKQYKAEQKDINVVLNFINKNGIKLLATTLIIFASVYFLKDKASISTTRSTTQPDIKIETTNSPKPNSIKSITPLIAPMVTASSTVTPFPSISPTPIPNAVITFTQNPTVAVSPVILPIPSLEPIKMLKVENWESKTKNATVNMTYDEDLDAIKIHFIIKGDGYVKIKTKPDIFKDSPGYKKLGFSYKRQSEENTEDLKIIYSNRVADNIAIYNSWKEIKNINIHDLITIQLYVTTTFGAKDDEVMEDTFYIRNLCIYP